HDGPYYKQAYWFLPEYGEWFLHLWYRYLEQVARTGRDHPFALINLNRGPAGAMYCLGQYNKAHAAACERIGLSVSKGLGTTPHGHRHAYGRRLKKAGLDKALIRRFMHHASTESQEVYTQPNTREALAALEAAAQRLRNIHAWTSSASGLLLPDIEHND
ncbi:MAG: tyrosine-type recombinase/integrase, partial [Aeromonas sobria]